MFNNPLLSDTNPSDPEAAKKARKAIFDKMREPVVKGDADNKKLRDKQAKSKFMPILGGDMGMVFSFEYFVFSFALISLCSIAGDPNSAGGPYDGDRWASITQLQHNRMKKWVDGKFVTGQQPQLPKAFKELLIQDQPAALTEAALEWSIGAALFPGIEVYWKSQFPEMWSDVPFRYADTVKPGDITKGLSLPWQSDFYMCSDHWCVIPPFQPKYLIFVLMRTACACSRWPTVSRKPLHLLLACGLSALVFL